MEILIKIISFALLAALIIFPILILNLLNKRKVKNAFIPYFISSLIITFFLVLVIAWWSHFSNKLLLSHYGYNFEGMDDIERFKNVAHENLEKVKTLRISVMGIGWPVKVLFFYPIYLPSLLIIYFGSYFYNKIKQKSK
ncbi:hypothetical protein [Flavobacterium pectinovorum]|uniref:Uncharacterized protein n=1 Tax=Flavobacterium pectinovorum TaxID=29533 RepID=A0A502EGM5_9FLAO|nr:hypothetical protein [Flavobacterium pectinovorum]TPG36344.1 hypothetical protein EAH81_19930 [Flavobacterium pectinovorum]